ncbi:thioesterase domain-containing protein [Marinobacter lutaoensis]|jgi:thioesterase domain-containing protein|uniref:Thioesterase n=1 Tax=Marinobacter lutaoensis TaxID=135739 RepID=A0A1V2DTI8_9GAMM|nr:thioesterase domain-containing protein [Marinobacter lutaoensis]MBE01887.1 thioesterase [Marinobacter sp.]MBI42095.1 thioesterase [Oceanospirillales bacterium]NVD35089.1 YiiD C-terminal domain-containing protein [Marinobacter lutaoensis]ONF43962.1 thioesterase [Marinobacter lutaoensis]|tara:strand:+ start:1279 stop:1758 length:480 start_codon:yes stop_codon:yes gene_type:complete
MSQLVLLQKRIHDEIPLSRALGIELQSWDGRTLVLSAPLEPNRNHQGTGFGGSVYAAAVTAAWGLTELALSDLGLKGHVVVQSGTIDYLEPVASDFFVVCRLPGGEIPERFRKSLARHGKARLDLTAEVFCGTPSPVPAGEPVAVFQGRFVVRDVRSGR